MTGQRDESGYRVATHCGPWNLEGPLTIVGGTAMIGLDSEGAVMVHCHAVFSDEKGDLTGGHLREGYCPLNQEGLTALGALPKNAGFKVAFDEETNFAIFHPLNHLS